jgi:hypothetical protein
MEHFTLISNCIRQRFHKYSTTNLDSQTKKVRRHHDKMLVPGGNDLDALDVPKNGILPIQVTSTSMVISH